MSPRQCCKLPTGRQQTGRHFYLTLDCKIVDTNTVLTRVPPFCPLFSICQVSQYSYRFRNICYRFYICVHLEECFNYRVGLIISQISTNCSQHSARGRDRQSQIIYAEIKRQAKTKKNVLEQRGRTRNEKDET